MWEDKSNLKRMPKLPVLMYHSVTSFSEKSKGLTIDVNKLEAQLVYLKKNGYVTLHFKDLRTFNSVSQFPKKAVILTFDDVYISQLELAYPLFKKYDMKASFFIPFKYVGGKNEWDEGEKPIMSVKQLQHLDERFIELGLHSFAHINYNDSSIEAIQKDLDKCKDFIADHKLHIHKTLAYPYGKYPKKGVKQHSFFKCLQDNGVVYGLRIGNRVNTFPFKNNYEVQRIDIKGEDSLLKFIWKLKVGKLL